MRSLISALIVLLMPNYYFSVRAQFSDTITLPSIHYGDTILYIYPTDNALSYWGGLNTIITSYDGAMDYWNGMLNTIAIVKQLGDNAGIPYAARVCDTLIAFGYNDWYLPAMEEMDTMYFKKDSIGEIFVFGEPWYWTSTESDTSYAVASYLGHFFMRLSSPKSAIITCRCIRRNFDTVYIPDNSFKSVLLNKGIDLNNDGIIHDFEARLIHNLNVSCDNDTSCDSIKDMTGIEAFVNLDTLNCSGNFLLSVLDVSSLVNLKYFSCSGTALTNIDMSDNIALTTVDLSKNSLLSEVCVWEIPFPPPGLLVDTMGSPNLYFTSECSQNFQDNLKEDNIIKVFPNPAYDEVYISVDKSVSTAVEIISLNGELLYRNELYNNIHHIDISKLAAGMYIIRITIGKTDFYEKLVVGRK